jgi:D-serine deaminase-like pyridoxal phosphate-dependent protein
MAAPINAAAVAALADEVIDWRFKGLPSAWWGRTPAQICEQAPDLFEGGIAGSAGGGGAVGPVCVLRAELMTAALSAAGAERAVDVCVEVGMPGGRRDVSFDQDLPVPLGLADSAVTKLNDQHAYLRLGAGASVEVGSWLGFGISHPCTVFDKWQLIPELDADDRVVGLIRTFF